MRDTVAGLVAAHRRCSEPELWEPYVRTLARRRRPIYVVLWLEEDRPSRRALAQRRTVTRGVLARTLKGKLRWLTTKVAVLDRKDHLLPDLRVGGRSAS